MPLMTKDLDRQYADSRKLAARAALHRDFSIDDEPWFPFVARRLGLAPGLKVLDVGCGPAWFWANAGAQTIAGIDLTLIDLSPGMVEEALERCAPLGVGSLAGQEADIVALPFDDGAFDVTLAMHMIYHVAEPARAIAELARVTKPGGIVAITTNGADNLQKLYTLTEAFGSPGTDPSGTAPGYDRLKSLLAEAVGPVERHDFCGRLRVTDPETVFLALTSYPPGDTADDATLQAFRAAIDEAFAQGGGALETDKQIALFIAGKDG